MKIIHRQISPSFPWFMLASGAVALLVFGILINYHLHSHSNQESTAPSLKAGTGVSLYTAKNKTYQANLGTTTGKPQIDFQVNQVQSSYTLSNAQSVTPQKINTNTLIYENIQPATDLKYTTLNNGIKEEIILKQKPATNIWLFDLNLTGTTPQKTINNFVSPTFTDASGHYAFHFAKPFAIDAAGNRNDTVLMQIETNPKQPNTYQIKLIVDETWLNDPHRVYPISIDPTVVHDTTAEFASGQFNRATDTGSGSIPSIESYYQELPADYNTVGLWHMNEASGTTVADSSGNSNTGTSTSSTNVTTGILASARTFNGSQYISAVNSTSLNPTKALTIEAWIYLSAANTNNGLVYKGNFSSSQGIFSVGFYSGSSNTLYFRLNGSTTTGSGQVVGNTALNTNTWYHVAMTYDQTLGQQKIYVNGVEDGSASYSSAINTDSNNLIIGGYYSSSYLFNGNIDEVRISNIARTPEEIRLDASRRPYSIYTSDVISTTNPVSSWNSFSWDGLGFATGDGEIATASAQSALVAQWNFNETSGTTAVSGGTCGTSCNGTLTNMTTTGQDAAADSGWTANNRRWGTGALMFDGSNDVVTTTLSTIYQNFTVSAWVKPSGTSGDFQAIISKSSYYATATNDFPFTLYANPTGTSYTAYIDSGNDWSYDLQTTASGYSADEWHYVVVSYDGSSLNLYIDGKLGSSASGNVAITTGSRSWTIGRAAYEQAGQTGKTVFKGIIDVVQLYSRSLTPAEILSNYNAASIEFQTRVGSTTDPNDGTWESWQPTTSESVIDSMDNPLDWATPSASIWNGGALIATSAATFPVIEGSNSLKIQTGQATSMTGIVGMWHLDETGGTGAYLKDASGNNNHGTPTGTTIVNGISGKSRNFNGSSEYVTVSSPTNIPIGNSAYTIEAWIKPTGCGSYGIVGWGNYGTDNQATALRLNNCNVLNYWWGNDLTSTGTININQWNYVAAVYNQAGRVIYINGVASGSDGATGHATPNANNFRIGNTNSTEYFPGIIDEVKISNVARSADEIAENYRMGRDHRISRTITSTDLSTSTKLPLYIASDRLGTFSQFTVGESAFANYEPDASTVGLWHLDEQSGSGAYLQDASGNANHGTPTNTTFIHGKIGQARNFNGSSDYIDTALSLYFGDTNLTTSVSFWAKGSGRIFGTERNGDNTGDAYLEINSNGSLSYTIDYLTSSPYVATITSATLSDTTKWNHYAIVINGPTDIYKFYVNGIESTSSLSFTNGQSAYSNIEIGRHRNNTWGTVYFNGSIDEINVSNAARTADEIRQAYEIGARTHNITIDFKANLDSGNLVTDSSDLSFTVDETDYGSSAMASHLFLGDKIIIKENCDGTEYLAQGTVNSVNQSTGAVTVSSWDPASSFPVSGFSQSATVFKWQREYFDLSGALGTHRDAITRLTYRITDGSMGTSVWLDDLRSSTGYLNTPTSSTITSGVSRYFQYRAILTSTDPAVSASLNSVSLNYAPVMNTPTNCHIAPNYTPKSIDIIWNDLTTGETGYQIERDIDGGGYSNLYTAAADDTTYTDSSIADNHQYTYRVRAYFDDDPNVVSNWCTTSPFNNSVGNFQMGNLQMQGIQVY